MITSLHKGMVGGGLTAEQLLQFSVKKIYRRDKAIQAWASLNLAAALQRAKRLDLLATPKEEGVTSRQLQGRLHGIPIGIKDMIDVLGFDTLAGSPSYRRQPTTDARLVYRLKQEGAVLLGKTTMPEFAAFSPIKTRNPLNPLLTPGGSSSGSAAAVAAGMCTASIGTQTAGSILRPAAFCGIVGFKPSHGVVSMAGVLPVAPSLDHVGIFAPFVEDVALIFDCLLDSKARASLLPPGSPPAEGGGSPGGGPPRLDKPLALGLLEGWMHERASRETIAAIEHAWDSLSRLPAGGSSSSSNAHPPLVLRTVKLSRSLEEVRRAHRTIMTAEVAQSHKQPGLLFPLANGTLQRSNYSAQALWDLLMEGERVTAEELESARAVQRDLRMEVEDVLARDSLDALVCPTAVCKPPLWEEGTGDPVFCSPFSLTGQPSIALPFGEKGLGGSNQGGGGGGGGGVDKSMVPYSLQLVGGLHQDQRFLEVAATVAQLLPS